MKQLKIIFILLLMSIPFMACNTNQSTTQKTSPKAVNGVLDLQDWDFEKDGVIKLDGEWEFYWEQFLTPEDFGHMTLPPMTGVIELPGEWNGYEVNGKLLTGYGYATYRLQVLLKNNNHFLALKTSAISTAATAHVLYVNEEKIGHNGKVGKTRETTTPKYSPYIVTMTPNDNQLDIIIQISNFSYNKGSMIVPFRLGKQDQIYTIREKSIAFELFLFGSIFIMGLYHFGLFALRRKDKSPLYFGLYCLLLAVRTLVTNEVYFMSMFQSTSWEMLVRIDFLTAYLAAPAFAMFVYSIFPNQFSVPILYVIEFIGIILSIIVFLTPAKIYTNTLQMYELFLVLSCIYIMYMLVIATHQKQDDTYIFIAGFLILFLAVINDILYDNNIIQTAFLVPYGFFIFIFSQSFMLSLRFSKSFIQT
ncbi:MAG: hypothetical protein B6242_09085, partial [Anaerolineaceae bacterium 4572_78]